MPLVSAAIGGAKMSWYEFLLFVHVACAVIWIGGGFLFQVYGMVELRSRDQPRSRASPATQAGSASGCLRRPPCSSCWPGSG